ncbi:hypothetical protein GE09DRAFT_62430 [Coniochaeta sp. 2T2.1]|nr:hypothetical protein GE09DRAFT_62430 [Coniochaeta sp. 2T2.1]
MRNFPLKGAGIVVLDSSGGIQTMKPSLIIRLLSCSSSPRHARWAASDAVMSAHAQPTPEEWALLPHDSRGTELLIITWVLVGLATIFLSLRVYCKVSRRRSLWWDDWIMIASWVLLVANVGVITAMVVYDQYGRHTWELDTPNSDSLFLLTCVRITLAVTALAWTKTAFAVTLLRVSEGWMKKLEWFIIISMNILRGLTALFLWIQCTPLRKSWTPSIQEGTCWWPNQFDGMWFSVAAGAYSAAMDFLLALLPWKLLYGMRMRKTEKFGIAVAMSMGFVVGIIAIIKTVKIPKLAASDLYESVDVVLWDITEISITIVAACVPVLRVLVRDIRRGTEGRDISDTPSWWAKWSTVPDFKDSAAVADGALHGPTSRNNGQRQGDEPLDDVTKPTAVHSANGIAGAEKTTSTTESHSRGSKESLARGTMYELQDLHPPAAQG